MYHNAKAHTKTDVPLLLSPRRNVSRNSNAVGMITALRVQGPLYTNFVGTDFTPCDAKGVTSENSSNLTGVFFKHAWTMIQLKEINLILINVLLIAL